MLFRSNFSECGSLGPANTHNSENRFFCDCVVPLRAKLFIFHGLLNRFPSVRGFPVELIYFILKPHRDKKSRSDLFNRYLKALLFPFFSACRASTWQKFKDQKKVFKKLKLVHIQVGKKNKSWNIIHLMVLLDLK